MTQVGCVKRTVFNGLLCVRKCCTINYNHMHLHSQQNMPTYGTVHTYIYYLIY